MRPEDITAIASTNRPGLIGCLLIGLTAAKTLAWAWGKPFVAVDHVQAHALSPGIGLEEPPPAGRRRWSSAAGTRR